MWCVCVCACAASICPSKQSWQTNLMWPRKGQHHSNCLSLTLCITSPSLLPAFSSSAFYPPFLTTLCIFLPQFIPFLALATSRSSFLLLPRHQGAEKNRLVVSRCPLQQQCTFHPVSGVRRPSACVSPRRRLRSEEAGGIKRLIGPSDGPASAN